MILWPPEPEDLLLPPYVNPLNLSAITGSVASFQCSFPALCPSDRHSETAYSHAGTEFKGKVTGWRPSGMISRTQGMAGTEKSPLPAKWVRARVRQERYSPGGEEPKRGVTKLRNQDN